jgi:hypothetical protein
VLQVVQAHAIPPDVQEFVLDDLIVGVVVDEPISIESIKSVPAARWDRPTHQD